MLLFLVCHGLGRADFAHIFHFNDHAFVGRD
jgi:hypothetical protein